MTQLPLKNTIILQNRESSATSAAGFISINDFCGYLLIFIDRVPVFLLKLINFSFVIFAQNEQFVTAGAFSSLQIMHSAMVGK